MVSEHSVEENPIPQRREKKAQEEQQASQESGYICTTRGRAVRSRSPLSPLAPRQSPTAERVHTLQAVP